MISKQRSQLTIHQPRIPKPQIPLGNKVLQLFLILLALITSVGSYHSRHKATDDLRLLAIMLSRFKMTSLEISQALLRLDDKLSIDDLKAISKQLPSPEEVRYY